MANETSEPRTLSDVPCDVCGKPSTTFHRDVFERGPRDGEDPFYRYFEPSDKKTFGCAEHPAC